MTDRKCYWFPLCWHCRWRLECHRYHKRSMSLTFFRLGLRTLIEAFRTGPDGAGPSPQIP